jgi:hypothetical protein
MCGRFNSGALLAQYLPDCVDFALTITPDLR